MKPELDLSNYATKADLKSATEVDTSSFAKKTDLANLKSDADKLDFDKLKNISTNLNNLKSKVDKLDADKLVPAPVGLSKLSDVIKDDVVKKDAYNARIKNTEDKIPDITNLATNASLNAKMNEVKCEIPSISSLATTAALTTAENKTPNVSNLVKITDHDHSNKYITTPEFDKLTVENFAARSKQANLASKRDIANFVNKTDFDNKLKNLIKKVTSNKTKHVLVDNELLEKVKLLSRKDYNSFLGRIFIYK